MPAVAGARPLQRHRHFEPATRLDERARIRLPAFPVEIHREKKASLVQQHRINAHDEVAALPVLPRKMPANHFIGDRKKAAIRTLGAFDLRFFAYAAHPFVRTRGGVTRFPGRATLEPARINILPPAKQRSEQADLICGRRTVSDLADDDRKSKRPFPSSCPEAQWSRC